jgi:hypothetical protein
MGREKTIPFGPDAGAMLDIMLMTYAPALNIFKASTHPPTLRV